MWETPSNFKVDRREPPHHPGLGLVRVTENGALAASRWMGFGDPVAADHAAQDAMTVALNLLPMRGRIVSDEEGRTGEASPLSTGADVGTGEGPELDVEINAIDGASLLADGKSGAMSVAALSPRGTMWRPGPAVYLDKIVVDRSVADAIGPDVLDAPPGWTLAAVARAKGKEIRDLVVFILERRRHQQLIADVRKAGARVLLRKGGDVGGALMAADPNVSIDVLMGVGGAAEGLMSACAVKALGGAMYARSAPQSEGEREACRTEGIESSRVLTHDDLIAGDEVFFSATGITDGWLLSGVSFRTGRIETNSMVLRHETGTRRMIHTEHRLK